MLKINLIFNKVSYFLNYGLQKKIKCDAGRF